MQNIMVDLETLGTRAGCSILSIGAVAFDHHGLGEEFYQVVHRPSCTDLGLYEDDDTLNWWTKQSPEARKVLEDSVDPARCLDLPQALSGFNTFVAANGGFKAKMWGNGADFDNVILVAAFAASKMKQKWGLYNNRCYRTAKSIRPDLKIRRMSGVHHNALDDAKNQAMHLIEIINGPLGQGLRPLL